jgi:hypothetical protein
MTDARHGYSSSFARFRVVDGDVVLRDLQAFVRDAGESQIRAWKQSIPPLQVEVGEVVDRDPAASGFTTILEYELPLDSRRADVVILTDRAVVVLELKGKREPSESDLDQAAAYGRDLLHYHAACEGRPVEVLLVATQARGVVGVRRGVRVIGPDRIDVEIARIATDCDASVRPLDPAAFLSEEAYRPLPTIIQAARELFFNREIRRVHRAHAATEPAVDAVREIVVSTADRRRRSLVLLAGTPGSGKTLVGLRAVHAHYLDTLSVDGGKGGKRTQAAVFLSGNGPLVEVLQHELRGAEDGGKTFVRGMFDFVGNYGGRQSRVPPQHVIVFDEAQRAFDAAMVKEKYARKNPEAVATGLTQPGLLADIARRIPEWSVLVGLVGEGQHIHRGEEGGIEQWAEALQSSRDEWNVHVPEHLAGAFRARGIEPIVHPKLNLDTELRFHLASGLHELVRGLLGCRTADRLRPLAERLEFQGYDLRITRDRNVAENYLRERYREHPNARFGMVASSRDKLLRNFGVANDFQSTKRIKVGPWFGDSERDPGDASCRHLRACVTEFQCQGLELDAALLAWGNDFVLADSRWDISRGSGFRAGGAVPVQDPQALRANSYRVLLTRGRDATVVWIPPETYLDRTFEYLVESGFRRLER